MAAVVEHGDPAVAHGTGADPRSVRAATSPHLAAPPATAPVQTGGVGMLGLGSDDAPLPRREVARRWPS